MYGKANDCSNPEAICRINLMNRILLVNLLTPVAAMVDLTGLLYGAGSEPIPVYLVDYRYSRQQGYCRE